MAPKILTCMLLSLAGFCLWQQVEAGSLTDIRKKTRWDSPVHSQRYQEYIPLVTPAELIASLDKYYKNTIRIKILFQKITSRGLNTWQENNGIRKKWSSRRYISFSAKDPQQQVSGSSIYLFINKNSPERQLLLQMAPGTPVMITGKVKSKNKGKAWIEVEQIEQL